MDLLAAARTASSLARFIEEDLVDLMARLDVDAAGIALSGLADARNRDAVYWSAVNHLEGAEAKLRSRMRTTAAFDAAQAYFYVSAIKALILRYLDEERLVAKCLADSLAISARQIREFSSFS